MLFKKACESLEDDIELYTVAEYNIYSPKMMQIKLKERYGDRMRLVTRDGKSNILVLDRVSDIFLENGARNREKKM